MADGFSIGSVTATIKADTNDFKKGIDEAKKKTSELGDTLGGIGKGIQDFSNKATLFTGALVAGLAMYGKSSLEAYQGAEKAEKALEHAVVAVTKATQKELEATEDLADALERKGVLDGDNIKLGLAQLSTFGLSNKAVRLLGGSLADLAVNQFGVKASGEQLADSANMIAKALNGQFGVLEKSGIRFTEAQKAIIETGTEMEKVKAITEGFAQNLKYTNDVAKQTSEGAMARLTVRLENIQEAFGKVISDAIIPFVAALADLAETAGIFTFVQAMGDQLSGFIESMRGPFQAFSDWVKENQPIVIGFIQALAMTIGTLVIIGTVNALLIALLNPFTLVIAAITAFFWAYQTNFYGVRDITNAVINAIIAFFTEYLMPFIMLVVEFFRAHWTEIVLIITTAWDIIKAVVTVATELIVAIFKVFFNSVQIFWKDHGEFVINYIKSMWSIIKGVFQVAGAVIMALVSVLTAFVTGDWNKAHDMLVKATMMAWDGIKNIFNGVISFIANWGGKLFSNLVRPFQDAWNRIQDLVNKIKEALDFTQRHSPSVLDIVQRGVGLVNKALGGLDYTMNLQPNMIAQNMSSGVSTTSVNHITIDMAGAFIGSEYGAQQLGEQVGDAIIDKLKLSVRI